MTYRKTFSTVRTLLFAIAAVCLFTRCQDDEFDSVTTEATADLASSAETENVTSLTIAGENTEFVSTVDCATCTYVVSEKADIIDGDELGLKPGSVICLDAAVKYKELTFVNLKGTTTEPIIIGKTTIVKR